MGKKILLADDSITIQKVIELTFSDEDFDVVTVGNGRLALEKVQEIRPDIVLCDIIMPEKDGYEVCEFIKKNPALQHIPVLLLTGAFEPFDQDRAARVGSDGYLAKPFEPETLIAKVKDLLSRAPARPDAPRSSAAPAIPFVSLGREPEPPRASPPSAPPPLTMVPPRPPEPIPFPRAASPEPFRAGPPPVEPPLAVSFIPEEPFEDLDPTSFSSDGESSGAARAAEPVPFRPPATDELLPMTAEESESLGVPDSASTVMFKASTVQWQTPAASMPVPPSPPAAPTSFEAAPVREAEVPAEPPVFEEVIEEYVEFGGAYEPPPPAYETPARPIEAAPSHSAADAVERATETVEIRPSPPSKPPASSPRAPAPSAPTPPAPPPAPPVFRRMEPPPIAEPVPMAALAPPWPTTPVREATPEPAVPAAPVPAPSPAPSVPPSAYAPPFVTHVAPRIPDAPAPAKPDSFADIVPDAPAAAPAKPPSEAAEVPVPVEMVETIAQRVVAQISEKVVREIAWDVIPDLAEQLIKAEIERLKAELQRI
jgi:CheY-like chemotaxis protein